MSWTRSPLRFQPLDLHLGELCRRPLSYIFSDRCVSPATIIYPRHRGRVVNSQIPPEHSAGSSHQTHGATAIRPADGVHARPVINPHLKTDRKPKVLTTPERYNITPTSAPHEKIYHVATRGRVYLYNMSHSFCSTSDNRIFAKNIGRNYVWTSGMMLSNYSGFQEG